MDQISPPSIDTSLAAHAFGELRAEISLLRRAVERLTDERSAAPDYAPSLEAITKRLEDLAKWAKWVSERPALESTPEILARQIADAGATARARDQEMLNRATRTIEAAGGRIDATILKQRSVAEQNRELKRNRIAFGLAGMVLFAILPGAVARSLPVSWAVPERMAARMLGNDMWHAGQMMMAKADPERWGQIVTRQRAQATGEARVRHSD